MKTVNYTIHMTTDEQYHPNGYKHHVIASFSDTYKYNNIGRLAESNENEIKLMEKCIVFIVSCTWLVKLKHCIDWR